MALPIGITVVFIVVLCGLFKLFGLKFFSRGVQKGCKIKSSQIFWEDFLFAKSLKIYIFLFHIKDGGRIWKTFGLHPKG
jgi:hypothetical protein